MLNEKNSRSFAFLFVMVVLVIFGTIAIYSFVENIEYNTSVFYATVDNDVTGVEFNEKVQNMAKTSAKSILGNDVKINISGISPDGNKIICYTKNVYVELDALTMHPVMLIYECGKGDCVLSREQCKVIAMRFALRNIPRKTKVTGAVIEDVGYLSGAYSYKIIFGDSPVLVSVRADTGSVIYYDATALF